MRWLAGSCRIDARDEKRLGAVGIADAAQHLLIEQQGADGPTTLANGVEGRPSGSVEIEGDNSRISVKRTP